MMAEDLRVKGEGRMKKAEGGRGRTEDGMWKAGKLESGGEQPRNSRTP
jgi:hypothetical protein